MPKPGQGTKGPTGWRRLSQREETRELLIPVIAVMLALMLGAVLVRLGGKSPAAAYSALVRGAFGGVGNLAETLINVTPLIFTGLAVALSFRCGLFNIGAEGQLIMGQVVSAWVGFALAGLPAFVHMPLALVAGVAAGAVWGAVPGYLKARLGVHEVINTIMMNYIALYFSHYLVIGPLKAPGPLPVTPTIAPAARLWRFLPPTRLHLGVILAMVAVWLVYYVLFQTTLGYEIRAVGENPEAARYGGISVRRNIVLAMVMSGGLAGAAGAVQVLGLQYKFLDIFSFTGYGFDGIAVALLGRNHPLGVLAAACLFGTLARGAILMQSIARIPKEIIGIVQATIVLFVAADEIIRRLVMPRRRKTAPVAAETFAGGVDGGGDHGA
ncbi:MAG: ABC transporter permease [Clostridia bacterium]